MRSETTLLVSVLLLLLLGCTQAPSAPEEPENLTPVAPPHLPPVSNLTVEEPVENITIAPVRHYCVDSECDNWTSIDYLIVTRPLFLESLDEFAEWKAGRGFSVGVFTADWMANNSEGLIADAIKSRIHELRETKGAEYALIVGDVNASVGPFTQYKLQKDHLSMDTLEPPWAVPTGYYCTCIPSYGPTTSSCTCANRNMVNPATEFFTDVFYADPNSWDPDGDGINEAKDSVTSSTEDFVFVGRWPVRTPEEVGTLTRNTISAQEKADAGLKREATFLLDEGLQWGMEVPDYCQEDYEHTGEHWRARSNKVNCESFYMGAHRALVEAGFSVDVHTFDVADPTQSDIQLFNQEFYSGSPIVYEMFHGQHSSLSSPGREPIANKSFNGSTVLLSAFSCNMGSYYDGDQDAVNEMILKKPDGPAVMVSTFSEYIFFKEVSKGKSVGEAFYKGTVVDDYILSDWKENPVFLLGSGNGMNMQSWYDLMGDPSFVPYPQD